MEDEKSPTSFSTSSSEAEEEVPLNEVIMRNTKTMLPKGGFSLNLVQTEMHNKTAIESSNKSQIIYRPKQKKQQIGLPIAPVGLVSQ